MDYEDKTTRVAAALADAILPAHNSKDRQRQADLAAALKELLDELCAAVVRDARDNRTDISDLLTGAQKENR